MTSGIIVTFALPGFHRYPDAPENVSFLSDRHRHLFKFALTFSVNHINRDIEFFTIGENIQSFITNKFGLPCEFKGMSCEAIACLILKTYSNRGCIRVEVYEDGENGAFVEK